MYIYQSSRVTVAVTGVCIGAHSCTLLLFTGVSECTCIPTRAVVPVVTVAVTGVCIEQNDQSSSVLIVKLMHIIIHSTE